MRGGLSLGLSGFSFWSCDIGGFEGNPPPWIYKRWVGFGLLCSHSRLHGSNSYRVPWLIDDGATGEGGATSVLRTFVRLKRRLMPYLYQQAEVSRRNGWPLSLRAMCLEFPDDPTSWFLDRQFMVGDSLLAAPVFTEQGHVDFYLPAGKWTSWWDGSVVEGPGWRREKHGFETLPLYVREGTVLVLGQEQQQEGVKGDGFQYDWLARGVEVRLYHTKGGESVEVVDLNGVSFATLTVAEGGERVEEDAGLQRLGSGAKVQRV